jgi:ribosomal protein L14
MLRLGTLLRSTAAATTEAAASAKLPAGNPVRKTWFRGDLIIRRKNSFRSRWGTGAEGYSSGVNFSSQVKMHCVDNTNCKHVRLIAPACGERLAHTRIFPAVAHRVSVLRFKSGRGGAGRQKIKPGTIYWVCLLSRRQPFSRMSGLITSFDRSTCVLMNNQRVPVGSRVMYVAGRHINHKAHLKAAVLANFFV